MQNIIKYITPLVIAGCVALPAHADERSQPIKEDPQHVTTWNRFFQELVQIHTKRLQGKTIRTTERVDGYFRQPDFYREVKYFDSDSNLLLSKIQWESASPETIHSIEIYFYNAQGKLTHDYLAAYLPVYRNAPIQTIISLYNITDELMAFRQFDASGERIYEQCRGRHFSTEVNISLEDYQLSPFTRNRPAVLNSEAYTACFGDLQVNAGDHLQPLSHYEGGTALATHTDDMFSEAQVYATLASLTTAIKQHPEEARNYLLRGRANFVIHDFHQATADLTRALSLDASLDDAWFWRGMSRGRQGLLNEGIADLGVYLQRQPQSSLAFTKRGVRHIWNNNLVAAEKDLLQAIALNPDNAEAHDDLGVLLSRRGDYTQAIEHFQRTIQSDPGYQKAYHNLAVVYQIRGNTQQALARVEQALSLSANDRNSLLLKGEVLTALGRTDEARLIQEQAEFLPEGNWSERMEIQTEK